MATLCGREATTFQGQRREPPQTRRHSMDYRGIFEDAVDALRQERRYRVFADLERIAGADEAAWQETVRPYLLY